MLIVIRSPSLAQPQAVNTDFDVFTCNRRDVLLLDWAPSGQEERHTVAFVAIGAMLVGSIGWVHANQGSSAKRGDELGYFAYGGELREEPALCFMHLPTDECLMKTGSTVVAVFPPSAKVEWDKDLLDNSLAGLETIVRVGDRIGMSKA